jgi:hypothetical protein
VNDLEIHEALSLTAYTFVLLEAVSSRALAMAEDWADSKGEKGHWARYHFDDGGQTTSSTSMAGSYLDASKSTPSHLVEYRACMELTLVVARNLSNMVSRTSSSNKDDVYAWQLVGVTDYTEDALNKDLLHRINKGSSLHMINFDDAEHRRWRIGDIRAWARNTLKSSETKLRDESPERADGFARDLAMFRTEMGQSGSP